MAKNPSNYLIFFGGGLLLAITILFTISVVLAISKRPFFNDFGKFYASVDLYKQGESLYEPVPLEMYGEISEDLKENFNRETLYPNLNPPAASLLLLIFSYFDIPTSYIIWSLLSIIIGLISIWIISDAYKLYFSRKQLRIVIAILLFVYFPTFSTLTLGQNSLLILLLLTIAWINSRRGNDIVAGIALGIALSSKLYIGMFLLLFFFLHRWKLLAWLTGTFLIINLIALLVFGPNAYFDYLEIFRDVNWYAASWNASFMGFFSRIFGGSMNNPLINKPELTFIFAIGCSVIVIFLLFHKSWSLIGNINLTRYDQLFGFTIVIMLLASPFGWMYYFVYLIIPFLIIMREILQERNYRLIILVMTAWLLSTIPYQIVPSSYISYQDIFFKAGIYFYALILFFVIFLILLRQKNSTLQDPALDKSNTR